MVQLLCELHRGGRVQAGSEHQDDAGYSMWAALNAAPSWTLGRTLLGSPALAGGNVGPQLTALELSTSNGWGNYNAAFLSFTARDWHGLTARSNFTWGRALGTGVVNQSGSSMTVVDPWELNHFQPANPSMNIDSPATWEVVTNQPTTVGGIQSRQMEFGLRLRF
jgi:hypothetical protein